MKRLYTLLLLAFALTSEAAPDHIVVVIEENHGYNQIMDVHDGYIRQLATESLLLTESYGVTHPSQPNYLALFSGSTQGVAGNTCPLEFTTDNLASQLSTKGLSFASYSESLPFAADKTCMSGPYRRKHNPAANWPQQASANLPFADFPQDFSKLPTVAFVIPNQDNDMHDGSIAAADSWLKTNIKPYLDWARRHNSLLILTWDEDGGGEGNHVVTILAGAGVKPGRSDQRINHYNVLRTLLDMYEVPAIGESRNAEPIAWRRR